MAEVEKAIHSNPANADVIAFTGFDFLGGGFRNNAATIFITQKPWDERKATSSQLVGEVFMKTGHIKEALVLAFNPPPIFGLGNAGGFRLMVESTGDVNYSALQAQADNLAAKGILAGVPFSRLAPGAGQGNCGALRMKSLGDG